MKKKAKPPARPRDKNGRFLPKDKWPLEYLKWIEIQGTKKPKKKGPLPHNRLLYQLVDWANAVYFERGGLTETNQYVFDNHDDTIDGQVEFSVKGTELTERALDLLYNSTATLPGYFVQTIFLFEATENKDNYVSWSQGKQMVSLYYYELTPQKSAMWLLGMRKILTSLGGQVIDSVVLRLHYTPIGVLSNRYRESQYTQAGEAIGRVKK